MSVPVTSARASRTASEVWGDLSTGARALVAAGLALVVHVAGLVTWRADSALASAGPSSSSAALQFLVWPLLVASVVAPVATLVLGGMAVRTRSGRALGAVAVGVAFVMLGLVVVATMGGVSL